MCVVFVCFDCVFFVLGCLRWWCVQLHEDVRLFVCFVCVCCVCVCVCMCVSVCVGVCLGLFSVLALFFLCVLCVFVCGCCLFCVLFF